MFQLAVVESWSRAATDRPDVIGQTNTFIQNVHCTCEGSNNCWKLGSCTAALDIEVRISPDRWWKPVINIVSDWEREHVDDYRKGIAELIQQGEWREEAERKLTFSSKETCEEHAASAVGSTLNKALDVLRRNTIARRDKTSGGHKIGPGDYFRLDRYFQ